MARAPDVGIPTPHAGVSDVCNRAREDAFCPARRSSASTLPRGGPSRRSIGCQPRWFVLARRVTRWNSSLSRGQPDRCDPAPTNHARHSVASRAGSVCRSGLRSTAVRDIPIVATRTTGFNIGAASFERGRSAGYHSKVPRPRTVYVLTRNRSLPGSRQTAQCVGTPEALADVLIDDRPCTINSAGEGPRSVPSSARSHYGPGEPHHLFSNVDQVLDRNRLPFCRGVPGSFGHDTGQRCDSLSVECGLCDTALAQPKSPSLVRRPLPSTVRSLL
jgi:hypothetical protein